MVVVNSKVGKPGGLHKGTPHPEVPFWPSWNQAEHRIHKIAIGLST